MTIAITTDMTRAEIVEKVINMLEDHYLSEAADCTVGLGINGMLDYDYAGNQPGDVVVPFFSTLDDWKPYLEVDPTSPTSWTDELREALAELIGRNLPDYYEGLVDDYEIQYDTTD